MRACDLHARAVHGARVTHPRAAASPQRRCDHFDGAIITGSLRSSSFVIIRHQKSQIRPGEKSLFGNNPMAPVWVGCERGDFRNEYDQTTWQLARGAHSRCRSSRSPRTSRWRWRFAQKKTEHAHVGVAHEAALGRKDPPILRLVTAPKFREAREKTRKHETTLNLRDRDGAGPLDGHRRATGGVSAPG